VNPTKTINETFTEEEYAQLKRAKGNTSWHDFILTLVGGEKKQ
jgi:predicted CopG family antitoxin